MNGWIKIEPGCRMPKDGEMYVCVWHGKSVQLGHGNGPIADWLGATHWLPIVPPAPEPDACARWLDCERVTDQTCRNWAREGWNAALAHARRDNVRMP